MIGYLGRRLVGLLPVLFAAATIVWILMFLLPGDPARLIAGGQGADPEVIRAIRADWGLDRPAPVQFLAYLGRLLRGDLGISYLQARPVADIIGEHLLPTLVLAFAGTILAALGGVALGCLAAARRGRLTDLLVLGASLVGTSAPVFWIGLLLIVLFASRLRWLPVAGYGLEGAILPGFGARLPEWDHLVLPALTLALVSMGAIARVTRAALLDNASAAFATTARARGAGRLRVFLQHGLRNALVPVVTVLGLNLAGLLGGAVATEFVFAWPGLGKALVRAIALRDLPVVEGCVLMLTLVYVLASLAVDLLYPILDPRLDTRPSR
ncbi:MAG TPA: ABC transporter permease [Candidatus Polarisedimenticolia bacterium]|nr:ABC transporter permease [Candidatus Polarisedimenticolia bacterium]